MGNSLDCFECFETPNIYVSIKTGDTKGAGLHNAAFITFIDEKEKRSREFLLHGCCMTVFKKGHTDVFKFRCTLNFKRICKVEIVRRDKEEKAMVEWFVEKIEVRHYFADGNVEELIFPCHRWIHNRKPVTLRKYDSTLSQFDNETEQRETELFWKRTMYRYHRRRPGIPPQVGNIPIDKLIKSKLLCFSLQIISFSLKSSINVKTPIIY